MSSITVEALRERAASYRLGGPSSEHTAAMLDAAADELLSLRGENERLREARDRAWCSLRSLQDGAAIAMSIAPETGDVADFLAAIHREAVRGQLADDGVTNEDARQALSTIQNGGEKQEVSPSQSQPSGVAPSELTDPTGEEFLEFKEALSDLRSLRHEYDCLNGGGPRWSERNKAAWARADELFANEDEAAYDRQQEDFYG